MAKKGETKSRVIPRDKKGASVSKEKSLHGAETWAVRSADGRFKEVVTTKASSAASMDRAVRRYSRALKSLAKR
jgi:hypothetical protein